jgi:hypothetical protein
MLLVSRLSCVGTSFVLTLGLWRRCAVTRLVFKCGVCRTGPWKGLVCATLQLLCMTSQVGTAHLFPVQIT